MTKEVHRDQPKHPAHPIYDPVNEVTLKGMSVKCWLVGQALKGILSRAETKPEEAGKLAVASVNAAIEAMYKDDIAEDNDNHKKLPPHLKLVSPSKEDEAQEEKVTVEDTDESPGTNDGKDV